MFFKLRRVLPAVVLFLMVGNAKADLSSYWETLKQDVSSTYTDGRFSLMIPYLTWHNRAFYDQEHLDKYNEEPWGLGVGLSRYEGVDWHGLYAMAFKDSNDYVETFFGYAFIKNYAFDEAENWRAGIGYTLGITQRHEYSYIPVPLPLPLASLTYRKVSVNAAYVPGIKNDGNVLFSWFRIDF
jgi:palmitoyl transferase